ARALDAAMAFGADDRFDFNDYRSWALDALAPRLDGPLLGRAFEGLNAIPDEGAAASALAALAPGLPDPRRALPLILAGVDPWDPQVLALLSSEERAGWLERATAIDDPALRARALTAMAKVTGEPQRREVLSRALAAALV